MKKLLLFAAFLILFAVPVLAQQLGDPPLPVPDYNPKGWKEYSFEKDKVKFRFPVEPKPVETTSGTVTKLPGRIYQRDSFMTFSLMALEAPSGTDIESKTGLILKMRDAYLEQIKGGDPKVIKDLEITVDDQKTYSMPVTVKVNLRLIPDSDVIESFCTEGESDLAHMRGQ